MIATSLFYPLDVIRTVMQSSEKDITFRQAFQTVQQKGYLHFYAGGGSLLRGVIYGLVVNMCSFDYFLGYYRSNLK